MQKRITPTKEQILAAEGKTIRDVIAPDLKVLFCGVNPGLYSGATGHHFARPGNRFWIALFQSGFTPRLLSPYEEGRTGLRPKESGGKDQAIPAHSRCGFRSGSIPEGF